ncbi:antibiotic biosynthesis monooxygenase [candidate division WOR-3 bacterium]|nr:antibiotic biosynthesis monooxygenase [candidate division WOR-3 bacterium]
MTKRLISLAMLATMTIMLIVISNCRPKTEEPPITAAARARKDTIGRVEVNLTFDVPRGIPLQAYRLWVNEAVATIRNAQGCVCCFVSRNIIDCPEVKLTAWWESLSAWAAFSSSPDWKNIRPKLNSVHATDINAEFWMQRTVLKTEKTEEPPVPDGRLSKANYPIEVNFTINLAPDVSKDHYEIWSDDVITATREVLGNRMSFTSFNIWDSPEVQWTSWWTKLSMWTEFTESDKWQELLDDLHSKHANTIHIEIWELEKDIETMIPDRLFMPKTEEPGVTDP